MSGDTSSGGDRSGQIAGAAGAAVVKGNRGRKAAVGASFPGGAAIVAATSAGRANTGRDGRLGCPPGRRQTSEERDANSASDGTVTSSRRRAGRKPVAIGESLGGGVSMDVEPGAVARRDSAANTLSAARSAGVEDISTVPIACDMRSAMKASQWAGASG